MTPETAQIVTHDLGAKWLLLGIVLTYVSMTIIKRYGKGVRKIALHYFEKRGE